MKAKAAAKEAAEEAERQKYKKIMDDLYKAQEEKKNKYKDLEGLDFNEIVMNENKSSVPSLKSVEELQLNMNEKENK